VLCGESPPAKAPFQQQQGAVQRRETVSAPSVVTVGNVVDQLLKATALSFHPNAPRKMMARHGHFVPGQAPEFNPRLKANPQAVATNLEVPLLAQPSLQFVQVRESPHGAERPFEPQLEQETLQQANLEIGAVPLRPQRRIGRHGLKEGREGN
jgi:hypothetical protein